jgi:intracellular septation protein A
MTKKKTKESPLLSIIINIAIPSLVLIKLSVPDKLGHINALLLALSFPLGYSIYELATKRKIDPFALIGLVSTLITGVVGLLALDAFWIAVKEAAIPFVIGVAVLVSTKTTYPLVKRMLYNDKLFQVEKIEAILKENHNKKLFDLRFERASYMFAGTFFFSSALNFLLARYMIVSPAGTSAFNEELGKMTAMSYPVIVLPSMLMTGLVLWYLYRGINLYTGLAWKDMLNIEE